MDVKDEEMPSSSSSLPHELTASEILLRLPAKSLLRFRCVCKPWRDTVSGDSFFSRAHTRRVRRQNKLPSSLLIAPYIRSVDRDGDFVDEFATPGLWLWEEKPRQGGVATLMYDMPWITAVEDRVQRRQGIAHCDGFLMLADAEGTVRVLNPATRRSLTLPQSPSRSTARDAHRAFGFGRVLGSDAYKVAHYFRRATGRRAMEVFTIGEDSNWRETVAEPPYPLLVGRTAVFFKGSLIWTVDLEATRYDRAACFIRFNLADESFSVMEAPSWYPSLQESTLAEIDGQLALVRLNGVGDSAEIWVCDDYHYGSGYSFNHPCWYRRRVLDFRSSVCPIAAFDDGMVIRDTSDNLYCLTSQGTKHMLDLTTLKYSNDNRTCSRPDFDGFEVIPYSPTLASI